MKKLLVSMMLLLPLLSATGQKEIFKGLFDNEEPVFYPDILPAEEKGVVKVAYHFTHSKINSLEVSFWIIDHGTKLMNAGNRQLISGLQEIGNRRTDTLWINGLNDLHFYTIGIDYRMPRGISRSFTSKVIREGYRYEFAPQAYSSVQAAPARTEPAFQSQPCRNPQLSAQIESTGYCGNNNRPAVMIQCDNCQDQNWSFNVEIRDGYGSWRPLRADGKYQPAFGNAVRTEPLCLLPAGTYSVRVSALGDKCTIPVIHTIGTPVVISGETAPYAYSRMPEVPAVRPETKILPDECLVEGEAVLEGDRIKGWVELEAGSPCQPYSPFARVRYVHPGYRDIPLQDLPLTAGKPAPFEILLDQKDLLRGVHPVQVAVLVKWESGSAEVPMSSFWINTQAEGSIASFKGGTERTAEPRRPANPLYPDGMAPRTIERTYSEPMLEESFDTVGVVAGDPNCTSIQNMQLVYDPNKPELPLFISWLNPRCCQEDGCAYTVWAGKAHDQLRLLIRGNKPGAVVRELLAGVTPDDQYFEVVVKTSNGNRKAAYVLGEGPKYGIEEIIAYHDRIKAPKSDTLAFVAERSPVQTTGQEPTAFGLVNPLLSEPRSVPVDQPVVYEKPRLPISIFKSCQYRRETQVIGDQTAQPGEMLTIKYDYEREGYQFTLYHLPEGATEWVLAPGTRELQSSPVFTLAADRRFAGKYLILAYKPDKNWGCLSAPMTEPVEIKMAVNE